jgi:hypothetical protein
LWGSSLNEAGEYSAQTFTQNLTDEVTIFMHGFFILPMLLFRWLAVKEYKRKSNGKKQFELSTTNQ